MKLIDFMNDRLQVALSFDSVHLADDYLEEISILEEEVKELEKQGDELIKQEQNFGLQHNPFDRLTEISSDVRMLKVLWGLCKQVPTMIRQLRKQLAVELNTDRIMYTCNGWSETLETHLKAFEKKGTCREMAAEMNRQVRMIVDLIPVLLVWTNPSIRDRHWSKAFQILKKEVDPKPREVLFKTIISWNPSGYTTKTQFKALNEAITNDHKLEETIESVQNQWDAYAIPIRALGTSGTYYVESLQEALLIVQEGRIKLEGVINLKTGTQEAIESAKVWQEVVEFMDSLLDVWSRTQNQFLKIRPLFSSKELCPPMSHGEVFIFKRLEQLWRENMESVLEIPSLLVISKHRALLKNFQIIEHDVEFLHKQVEAFVSKVRSEFARLYFVNEQSVLEITTSGYGISADIQRHVGLLFPGVVSLEYEQHHITRLNSHMGETLQLVPAVNLGLGEAVQKMRKDRTKGATKNVLMTDLPSTEKSSKSVQAWLEELESVMAGTVHRQIDKARKAFELSDFDKWMQDNTQQSLAVAQAILYSSKVEELLSDVGNKRKLLLASIVNKHGMVDTIIEVRNLNQSELARHKCTVLAMQSISERDMLQKLVAEDPCNAQDFAWQSQFRYSWELTDAAYEGRITLRMMQNPYPYGLEYLGNCMPLVWSASLEKCYKIVGSALRSHLCGGLSGNVSTCTSFITSLAHSFGSVHFPFACDLVPSPTIINQLCKGVASSTFWLTFKSVDNAPTSFLQTISLSILAVQNAMKMRATEASIDGDIVKMRLNVGRLRDQPPPGFFVTVGKQACGRILPDSLLTLFRPIVIQTPDMVHIIEVILRANGLKQAAALARKAHFAFQMFRELLPVVSHYNFSKANLMELIHDILKLKREYPYEGEVKLLIKALLFKASSVMPGDQQIFYDIVGDLSDEDVAVLANSQKFVGKFTAFMPVLLQFESHIFLCSEAPAFWKDKVMELFSASCYRNGIIAVGPSCTGKTICINGMVDAMRNNLANSTLAGGVEVICIFPKALSIESLYGHTRRISNEFLAREVWVDGLLPAMFRSKAKTLKDIYSKPKSNFIIMDGPMDRDWSDRLTLALGEENYLLLSDLETIPAPEFNTIIFETENLSTATPATVSKCGIVYFGSTKDDSWLKSAQMQVASWDPKILNQWIQIDDSTFATGRDIFDTLLDHILKPALDFISSECTELFEMVSHVHRVWGHLELFQRLCLDALREQERESEGKDSASKGGPYTHCAWLVQNFMFALVWSVGSMLTVHSQAIFDKFLRKLVGRLEVNVRAQRRSGKQVSADFKVSSFSGECVFEVAYLYTSTRKGWIPWKEMPVSSLYQEIHGQRLEDLVVPTVNYVRYNCLLGWAIDARLPILMNGPTACGKSMYIEKKMKNYLSASGFSQSTYNMTPATTLQNVHHLFWQSLEAKGIGQLAPKGERHLVVLIEDINLASRDTLGSSSILELVRHLLDKKRGYSQAMPPVMHSIENVFPITTNTHRHSGMNTFPSRLLRHFFVLNISATSDEDLHTIFSESLGWYHARQEFPESIIALREIVVEATLALYHEIQTRLRPTLLCPHYIFSLRDLNALLMGMMLQTKEDIQQSTDSAENEHLRLWTHEVLRVFYDRIKEATDKAWFLKMLKRVVKNHLKRDFDKLFKHLDLNDDGDIDTEELRRLFFGSWQAGPGPARRRGMAVGYDEIENHDQVVSLMTSFCEEYDAQNQQPMNLFMSLYSCEHISRLARILQVRRGHSLLLGSTGVGRRSLTRIAVFVGRSKINEIYTDAATDPDGTAWRQNFKRLIRLCGLGLAPNMAILLRDSMLTSERMQDVCLMLNGIEIPGLHTKEEKKDLIAEMKDRGLIQDCVIEPPLEELYAQFFSMAYDSMHLVICVDPNTKNLQDLLTSYPILASKCYVNWFQDWPAETLQQMAQVHLSDLFGPTLYGDSNIGTKLINVCGEMHAIALQLTRAYMLRMNRTNVHITMTDFATFLKLFSALIIERREEVESEKAVLSVACAISEIIKSRVKNVKNLGQEMLRKNEELIAETANEKIQLTTLQSTVSDLKKAIDKQTKAIADNKKSQKDTEEQIGVEKESIRDWWKVASQCILTFSPRDIGKLKSAVNLAQKCPECIEDLSMAVCAILQGRLEPSETNDERKTLMLSCKKVVCSLEFKKKIMAVNPQPDAIDKYLQGAAIVRKRFMNKKTFTFDSIARVCTGSEKVFLWVSEVLAYEEKVNQIIEPLKLVAEQLQQDRVPMEEAKVRLLGEHSESSEHLSKQLSLFEDLCVRGSKFEKDFKAFNDETELSQSMSELLVGEFVNFPNDWKKRLVQLTRQHRSLEVDCLLAAANMTYLGGLPLDARDSVLALWIQKLSTDKLCEEQKIFNLAELLIDSKELGLERKHLEHDGLIMDPLSVMNACIVTRSYKSPLVIDPHGVFMSWIQKREKANNLLEVSLKEEYLGKVRFAVEEGIPVLIKDVDHAVPLALQGLAAQQFVVKKGRKSVFIGDIMVPCNPAFRMYMVTRDECPNFSPEHAMWTTIVDFNLNQAGFRECVYNGVVAEKLEPVHYYQRICLKKYLASAETLDDLDPKHFLPSSPDDIVVDEHLVEQISRVRDDWMGAREVAMDNLRKYKAASSRMELVDALASPLASLFEALWQMTPLHVSYQNVQNSFVTLILMDLESAQGNEKIKNALMRENEAVFEDLCAGYEDPEKVEEVDLDTYQLEQDLRDLGAALSQVVFFDLVRSIYEKDHLLFAFLVAINNQIAKGSVYPEEFQHFLTNGEFRVPIGAEIRGTERVEIDDDEEDTIVWEGFGRTGDRGNPSTPHPGFSWLSEKQWEGACRLSSLKSIQSVFGSSGVISSITAHPEAWQQYVEATQPTQDILPHALSARLSPFQKLLLLRVFHPNCVLDGMSGVVKDWCGIDVSRMPPLGIPAAYEDSLCSIPLLFLMDPGTDPTDDIENFAQTEFSVHDSRQLVTLEATGSSVEGFDAVLSRCMEMGHWLLFRNVHMKAVFSKKLEDAFTKLENAFESFRFWITTYSINLSKNVYRSSMRVVWDAPISVRAGLLRSYSSSPLIRDEFFYQTRTEHQDRMFKRCIFSMCLMHFAASERSKYGAVGWNFAQQFTAFDLKFCLLQVQDVIQSFEQVTVKDVRQVVSELVYTGNFAETHDLETFKALLISFVPDSLVSYGVDFTEDGTYCMPEVSTLSDFGSYIEGLPTFAGAALFGLEESCDATRFEGAAEFYIQRLQDIHFMRPLEIQEDTGGGAARLHRVLTHANTLSTVKSLLAGIPKEFNLEAAKAKYPITQQEHRNRLLMHELKAKNKLFSAMRVSLTTLALYLDGEASVNSDIEKFVLSLHYQQIPDCWMKYSSLSRKSLGGYLEHLNMSVKFFNGWLEMGLPTSMWLPAFFFPNLLFSAALMNFSQHSRVGIESVALSYDILERDPLNTSMNVGVYITGLSLTGACWDFSNSELQPLSASNNINASRGASTRSSWRSAKTQKTARDTDALGLDPSCWSVPVLHVQPFRNDPSREKNDNQTATVGAFDNRKIELSDSADLKLYSCPMYRTTFRKNIDPTRHLPNASSGYIVDVSLPCYAPLHFMSEPQRFYVRLGTALLIEPDL